MFYLNIYTLSCPFTDEVFYVGRTSKPLCERLRGHCYCLNWANKELNDKIKGIIQQGKKPIITLVERTTDKYVETRLIHQLASTHKILNKVGNHRSEYHKMLYSK
jgi:molybdopterin-guanine dinucleotide biosynthesis protein A